MTPFVQVFAGTAPYGERKRLEPLGRNLFTAVEAEAVLARVEPVECVLNMLEGLGLKGDQRVVQIVNHVRQHCAVDVRAFGGDLAGVFQPVVHGTKNLRALLLERLTQTAIAMGFAVLGSMVKVHDVHIRNSSAKRSAVFL